MSEQGVVVRAGEKVLVGGCLGGLAAGFLHHRAFGRSRSRGWGSDPVRDRHDDDVAAVATPLDRGGDHVCHRDVGNRSAEGGLAVANPEFDPAGVQIAQEREPIAVGRPSRGIDRGVVGQSSDDPGDPGCYVEQRQSSAGGELTGTGSGRVAAQSGELQVRAGQPGDRRVRFVVDQQEPGAVGREEGRRGGGGVQRTDNRFRRQLVTAHAFIVGDRRVPSLYRRGYRRCPLPQSCRSWCQADRGRFVVVARP